MSTGGHRRSRQRLRELRQRRAHLIDRARRISAAHQMTSARPSAETATVHSTAMLAAASAAEAIRLAIGLEEAGAGMVGDGRPLADWFADSDLQRAVERSRLGGFVPDAAETHALEAVLYGVRGAAGEYWVVDEIARGDMAVPTGAETVELVPHHQPGVDLVFFGPAGEVATANVKVARDANVVVRHFEQHRGIDIVYATSDAAADARARGLRVVGADGPILADGPVVVDIGRSSTDFDVEISDALTAAAQADALSGTEIFCFVPWLALGAITTRAVVRLRSGVDTAAVLRTAVDDSTTATVGIGTGTAFAALGASNPLAAAASFTASILTAAARSTRRRLRTSEPTSVRDRLDRLGALDIEERHRP